MTGLARLLAALAAALALAAVLAPRAAADPTGQISGVATWAGGAPGVGVEVDVDPIVGPGQSFFATTLITDTQGRWQSPPLAAGAYRIVFIVLDAAGTRWTVASPTVTITEAPQPPIATTLSYGPPTPVLLGTLTGTVAFPAGIVLPGALALTRSDGTGDIVGAGIDALGHYSVIAPAGSYIVTLRDPNGDLDAATAAPVAATVTAGTVATADVGLVALGVTPGATAANAARALAFYNAERAQWGLPAGVLENPVWSQACGSHDAYLRANDILEHPEMTWRKGYSDGGDWAGLHSVLSQGRPWIAGANPWEDGPIHLIQLFSPDLSMIGIDDAPGGYDCATTWPGLLTRRAPAGTVFTYPGDGTTGLPPAEKAQEMPFVPGDFVGLPQGTIAGRELFVYEEGSLRHPSVSVASASLVDPAGQPVPIKVVDSDTDQLGGYLTGAIIIPVSPLAANTRYTATVSLNATDDGVPAVTHTWSFTTGAANPSGLWPRQEGGDDEAAARTVKPSAPAIANLRLSNRRFRVSTRRTAIAAGAPGVRSAAAPRGTALRFKLAAAATATVSVVLSHTAAGLRRGRGCVAPTRSLRRGHARRCMRTVTDGTLTRSRLRAGDQQIAFSGRVGSRALRRGTHRAALTARAGTLRSKTVTAGFTIVR